jgi:hypothetical protein
VTGRISSWVDPDEILNKSAMPPAVVVDAARGGCQDCGCLLECIVNSRYWTLAKRPPPPWPDETTFVKEAPIPTPGPGQALTRTIYVSLDPYQWGHCHGNRIWPAA